ncbi:MAG: hypothetical protein ACI4IX_04025 [Acutalibacteraceae bacterium]
MDFRNAEDSVPYEGIALILVIFKRANAVRPYRVADGFCCFNGKTAIICMGSLLRELSHRL